MHSHKVLVVDNDLDLVRLLEPAFAEDGAEVLAACDGQEGVRRFHASQPDLVIVDTMVPDLDGWEVCNRIHRSSNVPIILISCSQAEEDIVRGLECGAVDFVCKPFSVQVMLARARAALRAAKAASKKAANGYYDDGYLSIDVGRRRVKLSGALVDLTATEYRLLVELYGNAGRVLTYDQILESVWGDVYRDSPQYVHVYVYRLRQKLEKDPGRPRYLHTEHGRGYRFEKQVLSP